jgi:hypothetical protein
LFFLKEANQRIFHFVKAHQRRVIRVSKIFAENRSSGDARLKRERKAAFP